MKIKDIEDLIEMEMLLRKKKFHLYRTGINSFIVKRFEGNNSSSPPMCFNLDELINFIKTI